MPLLLWEHLADHVVSLVMRYGCRTRLYLTNLYDSVEVTIDADVLDREIDAAVVPLLQDAATQWVALGYQVTPEGDVEIGLKTPDSTISIIKDLITTHG